MKRVMRLVSIVVAFTQTVSAFTFWNGPSIIRQQSGELTNREKTLKIVLENQIYRVYALQEGQLVDDVATFAKYIFEQEVKPAFDRNEVTPDVLNLWTFCANAMLYRAEVYMRNIPWSAKIREARDKRMEASYQWEVRGKEVENGLSQFTEIDQPLNNWIACYNDAVVKDTFPEPEPLYSAFSKAKRNTSDTMEELTRQELDNLVFYWDERIKAEWKSQEWIINHPVMTSIGFGVGGALGGAVVVGGLSAMVASGVSTGAASGAVAGTTGFPVVGTIIGAVGGVVIGAAGGACYYYYRKEKEVRCKAYVEGGNALKKWYDVETKRDRYLRDALHQYKELRDSINEVFACLDTFKEKFGGVGDSLDVIDRYEENSTRRSEMLSDLEDMYVNYPLMIELVEGMVYVQFCLNALQENSETFSDERAVDKEELRTTVYETLCYVKRHFAAYFPNTTMMFMNVLASRYANSCRLPFVTKGRPASLSWKKENDEMEQWMRISRDGEQLSKMENEQIAKYGIDEEKKTKNLFFDILAVYQDLTRKENRLSKELFELCSPEGMTGEQWKEEISNWVESVRLFNRGVFRGEKPPANTNIMIQRWQEICNCLSRFTLEALHREMGSDSVLLAQLLHNLDDCKNNGDVERKMDTLKLGKKKELCQRILALPMQISSGKETPNASLKELKEYVQREILSQIGEEDLELENSRSWWQFWK